MGKHSISIRPISIADFDTILRWSKDTAFCLANDWQLNRDPEELYHWWLMCVQNKSDDFIRMGVEKEGKLIGYVDLANIKENAGELGIAIGESSLWGKGIGPQALKVMKEYAQEKYGITVFHAETHETNIRSRKMLEKIGFEEVGRVGMEDYLGKETPLIQYQLVDY